MPTYALKVQYCGTAFAGWARQPGLRTVEGELGRAIEQILREPARLVVAGRTDAGVHAWGQVASLTLSKSHVLERMVAMINGALPGDVRVVAAEEKPEGFSARQDARSRTYCYRIATGSTPSPFERDRAFHWPRCCDSGKLDACATLLRGGHDFRAFTPAQARYRAYRREVISARWASASGAAHWVPAADGGVIEFWIEADSFLRHMVRALVGTMLEVGAARHSIEDFERMLTDAARVNGGYTAPAHGLYLASVRY